MHAEILEGYIWIWGFEIKGYEKTFLVQIAWYKFNNTRFELKRFYSNKNTSDMMDLKWH